MLQEIKDALNGTNKRRARKKVAAGVTFGALMGAVAGLLFAPKSGKETRADIKTGAELGAEKAREAAHKATDIAKEKVDLAKHKADEFKKNIKKSKDIADEAAEDIVKK